LNNLLLVKKKKKKKKNGPAPEIKAPDLINRKKISMRIKGHVKHCNALESINN
jgi:hypothetical protein